MTEELHPEVKRCCEDLDWSGYIKDGQKWIISHQQMNHQENPVIRNLESMSRPITVIILTSLLPKIKPLWQSRAKDSQIYLILSQTSPAMILRDVIVMKSIIWESLILLDQII